MEIIVNGDRFVPAVATTIAQLVEELGVNVQKMAVEINGTIVPRSQYGQTQVAEGDRIEMVRFIGGG